jgi:hypothetical protein
MNIGNWTRRKWLLGCTAALAVASTYRDVFAADPDEITAERLKMLRTCESLTAAFRYYGDQDKPFYQITYHLGDFDAGASGNPFDRVTKLDREAMLKLLEALAKDGFIAAARDITTKDIKPTIGYNLTLTAKKAGAGEEFKKLGWQAIKGDGHVELYQPFGWDLKMIERLEGLQPALKGEAAKDMEFLLGRLSGLKREWQKTK